MEHPFSLTSSRTTISIVGLRVACVLAGCSASPAPRPPQPDTLSSTPPAGSATQGIRGNGYREQWHIWVAGADGSAEQVPIPIAWTSRCGDNAESVTPTDGRLHGARVPARARH